MPTRPLLIVFAKAPIFGGAKSRLAAGIGKVHANRIYRAMTRQILRRVSDPRWDCVLAVTPDNTVEQSFGGVWPARMPRFAQGAGTLSGRLARAFSAKRPVIVIGTDAPQVRAKDIASGFKAIKSGRAVFGPADDGGFWLVGLYGPADSHAFDNVDWSTDKALSDVISNMGEHNVAYLRTLIDVDDVKALQAVRGAVRGAP